MIALLFALACAPDASDDDTSAPADDAVDLRLTDADLPAEGDGDQVWWGPDEVIQPGEDKMYCLFGTYTGDDLGLHTLDSYQNKYGHHLLLMGTSASPLDYPDGTVADCSINGSLGMTDLQPFMLVTGTYVDGVKRDLAIDLQEGMAIKLNSGQRWVLQAHYINTGTDSIRAQDALVLGTVPVDSVTTWAAPFILNSSTFNLPPSQATTFSFECPVEADLSVLYVTGHMHQWGTSFKTELDGTVIYDEPEWNPQWRDAPPVQEFDPGTMRLTSGSTIRTTCSWFNDTEEALEFPTEMCDTVTVVYPQLTSIICDLQ
jgi:hypothetical protein